MIRSPLWWRVGSNKITQWFLRWEVWDVFIFAVSACFTHGIMSTINRSSLKLLHLTWEGWCSPHQSPCFISLKITMVSKEVPLLQLLMLVAKEVKWKLVWVMKFSINDTRADLGVRCMGCAPCSGWYNLQLSYITSWLHNICCIVYYVFSAVPLILLFSY